MDGGTPSAVQNPCLSQDDIRFAAAVFHYRQQVSLCLLDRELLDILYKSLHVALQE